VSRFLRLHRAQVATHDQAHRLRQWRALLSLYSGAPLCVLLEDPAQEDVCYGTAVYDACARPRLRRP
jgi:hypothetical protein